VKIFAAGLKWFPDGAEAKDMRPRTRLDPVIKIEEKNEERKLHEMAAANRKVKSAEAALTDARDAARGDHRRAATATDWMLAENAHTRALSEVRKAERAMKMASDEEGKARGAYTIAHSKAEALRRVAQARVDEILTAREKAESKELDEIGLITFNGSAGQRPS
jgi:flagellar biosynthesis chaperone FliJ